jgi:hypothetical protein
MVKRKLAGKRGFKSKVYAPKGGVLKKKSPNWRTRY